MPLSSTPHSGPASAGSAAAPATQPPPDLPPPSLRAIEATNTQIAAQHVGAPHDIGRDSGCFGDRIDHQAVERPLSHLAQEEPHEEFPLGGHRPFEEGAQDLCSSRFRAWPGGLFGSRRSLRRCGPLSESDRPPRSAEDHEGLPTRRPPAPCRRSPVKNPTTTLAVSGIDRSQQVGYPHSLGLSPRLGGDVGRGLDNIVQQHDPILSGVRNSPGLGSCTA